MDIPGLWILVFGLLPLASMSGEIIFPGETSPSLVCLQFDAVLFIESVARQSCTRMVSSVTNRAVFLQSVISTRSRPAFNNHPRKTFVLSALFAFSSIRAFFMQSNCKSRKD